MKKMSKWFKQIISFVIVVALVLPMIAIQAEANTSYEQVMAYEFADMEQQMLYSDEALAIQETTVTFPGSAVSTNTETDFIYHVFRQGDASKELTISISTFDITAEYGKEYEIIVNEETVKGKANPILEGEGTLYNVYIGKNVLNDNSYNVNDSDGDGIDDDLNDSLEKAGSTYKEMASSSFELTFAEGQTSASFVIRAHLPKAAAGNQEFQLTMMELSEDVSYGTYLTTAVTIIDSRETEPSEINILPDTVEVVDGYVSVLVERTGNTDSTAIYTLSSQNDTAKNGTDFVLNATELTFTPGVTQHRVYIPLVASEVTEQKTFALTAAGSTEQITYTTTSVGATYAVSRDVIHIPMSEFEFSNSTVDADNVVFEADDSEEKYNFSFTSEVGDGKLRTASICTKNTYDFTGIESIKLSASLQPGTVAGDYLRVYASDTDLYNDEALLETIGRTKIGTGFPFGMLMGQSILTVPVDCTGEKSVYITMQQHSSVGVIGYNLYDQEYQDSNDSNNGHVMLVKTAYELELVSPKSIDINGTALMPAGDLLLTLTADSAVKGTDIDEVYVGDSFAFSYVAMSDVDSKFAGWELLSDSGNVIATFETESPSITINSDILKYVEESTNTSKIRLRPIFERDQASLIIETQDFEAYEMENMSAVTDFEKRTVTYYDNGVEVAVFSWNSNEIGSGESLQFSVDENEDYEGLYHFDSFKVETSDKSDFSDANPLYYSSDSWSTIVDWDYYRVTPIISCKEAPLYMVVVNGEHGNFASKSSIVPNEQGQYVVTDYDGKYGVSDVVSFVCVPDEGYMAKWSYRDVITNTTKVYYGNTFHYEVQLPVLSTDNYVTCEFVKTDSLQTYQLSATVYMQGGDILHQPDPNSTEYFPLANATVLIEALSTASMQELNYDSESEKAEAFLQANTALTTGENGTTGEQLFTVVGLPGQVHRAKILANNRYYVVEFELPGNTTGNLDFKLSYYYNGPRVVSMTAYDHNSVAINGDTIYLENTEQGVIIGAAINTAGKEVTGVYFSIVDEEGNIKETDLKAELTGNQYLWSSDLANHMSPTDSLWIEIVNEYEDADGIKHRESYGKVETGYHVIVAEYSEVSYLPDIGSAEVYYTPLWGNTNFLFSAASFKPVISTSRSGNIYTMNIGVTALNSFFDFRTKSKGFSGWDGYVKTVKSGLAALDVNQSTAERKAATQKLTKVMVSFNIPMSFQIMYYLDRDDETLQVESCLVASYFIIGVNAAFTFNIPFTIYGLPCFVNIVISAGLSDAIQIMLAENTGIVQVDMMSDPTKLSFAPENKLNFNVGFTILGGVGANSVCSFSVGGGGKFKLLSNNFETGSASVSITADMRFELFLIGRSFSWDLYEYEIYNTITDSLESSYSAAMNDATDSILEISLNDLIHEEISSYTSRQSVQESESDNSFDIINSAYQFSEPAIISMADGRYMIVATIGSKFVSAEGHESSVADAAVLSYAIYDPSKEAGERLVKNSDGKYFRSIEPASLIGNSINYNPSIVCLDEENGDYAVVWNSIELKDKSDAGLTVDKCRSVIKSAIIQDVGSGQPMLTYRSIVVTNESDDIMPSVVLDLVYDETQEQILLLYKTLDFSGLTENSTVKDVVSADSWLYVSSLGIDIDHAQGEVSVASDWSKNPVQIYDTHETSNTIIKNADIEMLEDTDSSGNAIKVPVIAFNVTTGENATLISNAEDGSENHIILKRLDYLTDSNGAGYTIDQSLDLPLDYSKLQINPVLSTIHLNDQTQPVLMWRQENRMAVADPIALLKGEYDSLDILFNINEIFAGNTNFFQLVEGSDGRTYAFWVEANTDASGETVTGQVLKASVLEAESVTGIDADNNEVTKICGKWSKGVIIAETTDSFYLQSMNLFVDKDSSLKGVGRATKILAGHQDDGLSNIRLIRVDELYQTIQNGQDDDENIDTDLQLLSDDLYNDADLEVTSIDYEALSYTDGVNPDSYVATAKISNRGGAISEASQLVISYPNLYDDTDGETAVEETILGSAGVYDLLPGESTTVTIEFSLSQDMYPNASTPVAAIAVALYTGYGTDEQYMDDGFVDGVQKLQKEEVTAITMGNTAISIALNTSKKLDVGVLPLAAQHYSELTYSSSDSDIVIVDESGIITGLKKGTAIITISAENGTSKTVTVAVTDQDIVPGDEDGSSGAGTSDDKNGGKSPLTFDFTEPVSWVILVLVLGLVAAAGVYLKKKRVLE